MNIALHLMNYVESPEFDYPLLLDVLKDYKNPRQKITDLIRSNLIIRVKKGIYVLGPSFHRPYSKFILANMIYGPSYISGMTALSYYQLIPEQVHLIESRCMSKNKSFQTPVGTFEYRYLSPRIYSSSYEIQRVRKESEDSFLMASKEKALIEILLQNKEIQTKNHLADWIYSLRLEESDLMTFSILEIKNLSLLFKKKIILLLLDLVKELNLKR